MQALARVLAAGALVLGLVASDVGPVLAAGQDPLPGALGPAPTDQYVDAAHLLFLGRSATDAELARWRHLVHQHGPGSLTAVLATSREWAGTRIDELYRSVLGREPDGGGRGHWLSRVAGGTTLEEVAATFYGSAEYLDRVGGTARGFVDSLYRVLLVRDPDHEGRRHWLGQLERAEVTRTDVARSFFGSVESRRRRVDEIYAEVLDRAPDADGRTFWAARLAPLGDVAVAASLAAGDEFHRRSTGLALPRVVLAPVGPGTRYPLRHSWRPGCPVHPDALVAVEFDHFTMDGTITRGVLVVHRSVVGDVATVVRALYGTRFPLRSALPVDHFGGDDDASMRADNSSAFNCRTVAGTTTWSQHAYGVAVDLNPVENPYVREGNVDPPAGAAYTDRSDVRPGMIVEGGPVVAGFDRLDWGWGGRWLSGQDHQHFSTTGR